MPRRDCSSICINSETKEIYAHGRRIKIKGDTEFEVFRIIWSKKRAHAVRTSYIFHQLYQLRPDCDIPKDRCGPNLFPIIRVMIYRLRARLAHIGVSIDCIGWGDCSYSIKLRSDLLIPFMKQAA